MPLEMELNAKFVRMIQMERHIKYKNDKLFKDNMHTFIKVWTKPSSLLYFDWRKKQIQRRKGQEK